MALVSIRLPDDIDSGLAREAERTKRSRSEVAREAITEYLRHQERERYLSALESAARAIANDPASRREAQGIAEEFLPLENEVWAVAEPQPSYGTARPARAAKRKK